MSITPDRIADQIAYYRARAGEYDEWFYRLGRYDYGAEVNQRWFDEVAVVMAALQRVGPVASILELAYGTGNWTRALNDGREFAIVKIFYDPAAVCAALMPLGFNAAAHVTEHYFYYVTATRASD